MPAKSNKTDASSPPERLGVVVQEALALAKKAKRNKKTLSGDNFYAQKFAGLRADATNLFNDLTGQSAGDVSAMAEMIGTVFDASSTAERRRANAKDLLFSLRTTWRDSSSKTPSSGADLVFPMALLAQSKRGYLAAIGRQMNDCCRAGHYDACAVMMRRLLEVSIIEAFEACGIAAKIKGPDGNYLHLTDMVNRAIAESSWNLSRTTKKFLPQLRDVGHLSAHGRYFTAQDSDISNVQPAIRVTIEEFLHLARLL
jgi:hypothetical protein